MSATIPITVLEHGELVKSQCTCPGIAVVAEGEFTVASTAPPSKSSPEQSAQNSYGQILKSSALVGGASVLKIGIGIIRTKAMAMLLGPAGFGLFGLYGSVSELSLSVANMGVNSSGVRQIAEAAGTGDTNRIAQTAAVLRRTSLLLGLIGALLLAVFSRQVSQLTFGNKEHGLAISLLAFVLLFRLVSDGQGALIQGMRRIRDLANMSVLGGLYGTVVSIPMVYYFREQGIVPSMIVVAAASIFTSWWYSRKIPIARTSVRLLEVGEEVSELLKLGFVFMSSGLMTMGTAYAVRIIILRQVGFAATGLYQSAWTLGGLYVGFILQAMGADFYPRLTASANDNATCNRLVNEQTLIGLLLAGPGVLATLTLAPLVISVLYSAKFGAAVPVLRWICLGVTLQVITWPMGYIIVAKAKKTLFFFAETAWAVVAVALAWTCVNLFGLNGGGIAFFLSYVFHGILIYAIVRSLSGFRPSGSNIRCALLFLLLVTATFSALYLLSALAAAILGLLATAVGGIYAIHALISIFDPGQLPRPLQSFLKIWRVLSQRVAQRRSPRYPASTETFHQ